MRSENSQLRFTEKLGYGLGDAASNFFFQVFSIFLLNYYTDVFGLSAAAVGTMFIVTRALDAVSDPLMGAVADRTRSRWGKFRPYLLWASIPYGVLGYAMFANPDIPEGGKLFYAYATYGLMMLAYTAVNIPYSSLMGVISPSSEERTKVSAYRFVCAFSATWLIATFVMPLKSMLGRGDEAEGYRLTMMLFAILSVVLFWVCFAATKERVHPIQKRPDLKKDLRALAENGPWLVLLVAAIFTMMNVAIRSGATIYYMKYFVSDSGEPVLLFFDKTAVFMSSGLLSMIAGVALTKPLCRRFDKRRLMIGLTLVNAAFMGSFYLLSPEQFGLMLVVNCVGTLLAGPTPALIWSMYADCADYGEWKTERRTTGLIFSGVQFAQKMGLAVGAGASAYLLSYFGYVANVPQSESAMIGIRLLFCVFPALLAVASAGIIVFYRLDDEKVVAIEGDLETMRVDDSRMA